MLHRIRVEECPTDVFERCWALYVSAFPRDERRDISYHREAMGRAEFCFEAIFDGEVLVGFIGWWDFAEVCYIEHFAIFDECRGGGYGGRVLEAFKGDVDRKLIILEVEFPVDSVAKRRIAFYERYGFYLSEHPYMQPSYWGTEPLPLALMSYPNPLETKTINHFIKHCLPKIHFRAPLG